MKTLIAIISLLCFAPTPNNSHKASLKRILPQGTTIVYEPIILGSNQSLFGHPLGSTLKLAPNSNCPILIIGDTNPDPRFIVQDVHVSSITFDGSMDQQQYEGWGGSVEKLEHCIRNNCITIRGSKGVVINNVDVSHGRSGGIVIERDSENITIVNSKSSFNHFDGLAIYKSKFIYCNNVTLTENYYAGFSSDLDFRDSLVARSNILKNGREGVFMRFSRGILFNRVDFSGNIGYSVFLAKSGLLNSDASNNIFSYCSFPCREDGIKENDKECKDNLLIFPFYEDKDLIGFLK